MQKLTLTLPDQTAAELAAIATEGGYPSASDVARSIIAAVLDDDKAKHTAVVTNNRCSQIPGNGPRLRQR